VERLLGVMLSPIVTVLDDEDLQHYARFTLSVMRLEENAHPFDRAVHLFPCSMELYTRLQQALSHLPQDVFRRRLGLASSVFLSAASQLGGKPVFSARGYGSRAQFFRDIYSCALAVLRAPYSPEVGHDLFVTPG
jgi:exonuclease VII small subunit